MYEEFMNELYDNTQVGEFVIDEEKKKSMRASNQGHCPRCGKDIYWESVQVNKVNPATGETKTESKSLAFDGPPSKIHLCVANNNNEIQEQILPNEPELE